MKGDPQLEPIDKMKPTDADPLLEKPTVSDQSVPESSTNEITNDGGDDEEIDASSAACCRICLEYNGEPDEDLISPCMCKGTQQFVHRSCLDHWRSVKEGFAFSHCTTCKAQFHLRAETLEDNSWQKLKFRIFVARDVLLVFLAVQTAIAAMGGFAYFMDKNGNFRNSFSSGWDRILSKHPIPFYYCIAEKGPMILILTYRILGVLACDVAIPVSFIRETHSPPKGDDDVISLNKLITKMLQIGVLAFFVMLGFFGLILHCSSLNNNDPCAAGCRNCCYGWGILDCFPASMEACFALLIVFIIIFAILGIAYGFLAATMAIQRIWQRHYHVLTKRELTKEYVVEDLQGCYTLPKLDPEHEERLKMLKLL